MYKQSKIENPSGPKWAPSGTQVEPKWDPSGPKWTPSGTQVGTKWDQVEPKWDQVKPK